MKIKMMGRRYMRVIRSWELLRRSQGSKQRRVCRSSFCLRGLEVKKSGGVRMRRIVGLSLFHPYLKHILVWLCRLQRWVTRIRWQFKTRLRCFKVLSLQLDFSKTRIKGKVLSIKETSTITEGTRKKPQEFLILITSDKYLTKYGMIPFDNQMMELSQSFRPWTLTIA